MYIRTIKSKNKDGSVVEYVQLANNVWNKKKGFAQAQVIYLRIPLKLTSRSGGK
jgi:hypothetical protein